MTVSRCISQNFEETALVDNRVGKDEKRGGGRQASRALQTLVTCAKIEAGTVCWELFGNQKKGWTGSLWSHHESEAGSGQGPDKEVVCFDGDTLSSREESRV